MSNLFDQDGAQRSKVALATSIVTFGFLSLAVIPNSHAQDSERIDKLEREIQEIKARLSKLETSPKSKNNDQEAAASSEGWKSLSNWRLLATGMSPRDVRRILGEPHRINGGSVAFWYYPNRGQVSFIDEKVQRWEEPR